MYKIAICDDDNEYLLSVEKMIKEIIAKNRIDASVSLYSEGKKLIEDVKNQTKAFNLIVFDIMLGNENGIELACELHKYNAEIGIVFVTTSSDFLIDGYDAEPSGYVLKPIEMSKLERAVLRAYQRFSRNNIMINDNGKNISINIDDILYVDVYGKILTIHLADSKSIQLKKALGDIIDILPETHFIQCHRSYIVSLSSIVSIRRYELELSDSQVIPVSKRCYATVQTALIENGSATL